MDDTLCDFIGEYRKRKTEDNKYPQSNKGFFEDLPPLLDAINGYKILEKYFDVRILTAPSVLNPLCYTEKRLWVEKHLGMEACHKMIICPDKSLLKGHFLIDDSITKGQDKFEGKLLRFGHAKYSNWYCILKYFKKLNWFELFKIKVKRLLK